MAAPPNFSESFQDYENHNSLVWLWSNVGEGEVTLLSTRGKSQSACEPDQAPFFGNTWHLQPTQLHNPALIPTEPA